MSEKMTPIDGESQKKRVVCQISVFILPDPNVRVLTPSPSASATFSIRILVDSTMGPDIRARPRV